uniref:Predicted protein n=1 Tax=Hordeum vulgare subsp. vulgare TaxID=112509 RepID=F2D385_HORVV|nr:predicted protein [Hordeum vulgare subsp. vulgare]
MLFTTFRSTKTIDQLFYCILYRFLHSVQKLYNILLHIVTNLQCSETTRRGAWLALFTQSIQRLLCLNLELDGGCYKSTRRTVTPATDDNRVRGRWSWKPTNERTVHDALLVLPEGHHDLPVQRFQDRLQRVENLEFLPDDGPASGSQDPVHLDQNGNGFLASTLWKPYITKHCRVSGACTGTTFMTQTFSDDKAAANLQDNKHITKRNSAYILGNGNSERRAYPPYTAFISSTFRILVQLIPKPSRYDFSTTAFQWLWSADTLVCRSPSQSGKVSSLLGHSSGHSLPLSSIPTGALCRQCLIGVYLQRKTNISALQAKQTLLYMIIQETL